MISQQLNLLRSALEKRSAEGLAANVQKIVRAARRRSRASYAPPYSCDELRGATISQIRMSIGVTESIAHPDIVHPQKAILQIRDTRNNRQTRYRADITHWQMPDEIEKEFVIIKEFGHLILREAFYADSSALGDAWAELMRYETRELFRVLAIRPRLLGPVPDQITVEQELLWRIEQRALQVAILLRAPKAYIDAAAAQYQGRLQVDPNFCERQCKLLSQTSWRIPLDIVTALMSKTMTV